MNWKPKYTITDKLLYTIREIGQAIGEIKGLQISAGALAKLEVNARELSTYASTSIEGNPLPLTDVKRLLKTNTQHIRNTEREVLNYNQALQDIYSAVADDSLKLDIKTLEQTQAQVVDSLMDNPVHIGSIRNDAVVIRNPRKVDEIVFLPPNAKDVKALMNELLSFVNNHFGKIDPVILAGLFHRQCVIIHPFIDGNGRTTRLITSAVLGKAGLDLFRIFSFENYYNQNITRYFREVGLIGDYYDLTDDVDFTSWLEYFAEGILDELSRVRKTLTKVAPPQRLEAHHQQILNYLDTNGSITQREYGDISSRSLAARKQDFDRLLELKLIEKKGRSRGTYYIVAVSD